MIWTFEHLIKILHLSQLCSIQQRCLILHCNGFFCEIIDSLIVKSANDAAVAIAEKISDSEKKFVIKMNNYAKKLNLENTNFANPHGLPNRANLSTAYDIFKLSSKIIKDFPEYIHRFKKTKVNIKGKVYNTHNTLL